MNRIAEYIAKLIAIMIIVIMYVTLNQNKEYDINTHLDNIWMWGKD